MRKNKKLLALVLSMVNVLGLSKSNANPKGESKKDAVVNESKDKNASGSGDLRNNEAKNKLKKIFSEYNLVTKRNVLDLLLVALGGGYIYKQRRNINLLNSKSLEVKKESVENKPLINPVDPLKKDKNNLDPNLKKFLDGLAAKADKEFEDFVKSRDEIKTLFAGEDLSTKDFPANANPDSVKWIVDNIPEKNKSKLFFGGDQNKLEGNSYDDYRKFAGVSVEPPSSLGLNYTIYGDYFSPIDNNTKCEGSTGWKIHISPDVFHCKDVLELVYQYHDKNKIHGKFIRTLPYYRHFNKTMLDEDKGYQVGKFITIYPKNDKEAKTIVESLHAAFEKAGLDESCFLEISDDFKVYPGIYVRMSEFSGGLDDRNARGKLGIPFQVFAAHCKTMNTKNEDYKHPFNELSANGVEMPKEVCEINNKLQEIDKK